GFYLLCSAASFRDNSSKVKSDKTKGLLFGFSIYASSSLVEKLRHSVLGHSVASASMNSILHSVHDLGSTLDLHSFVPFKDSLDPSMQSSHMRVLWHPLPVHKSGFHPGTIHFCTLVVLTPTLVGFLPVL
uniref:Uncharacterized protein n=1 Tax=Triticum urartu TaxID=4572 RepID=A0A8R7QJS0_TRIUA